jgi:phosphatidylglycerophosphate synthase
VPDQTADRRPIAARNLSVFIKLATALARAGITPNTISVLGMISGILAGVALAATPHTAPLPARLLFLAAAGFIQLRLLANMLDGMVAISSGKTSPLGELYNDVPDRISDAAALIGLGYAVAGWPEMGFIAALLAILTAYIRAVGRAAGAPSDFRGPMAKQQRMFLVTLASLVVALSPERSWHFWGPHTLWGLPAATLCLIALGSALTCLRRLAGIASNLRKIKT